VSHKGNGYIKYAVWKPSNNGAELFLMTWENGHNAFWTGLELRKQAKQTGDKLVVPIAVGGAHLRTASFVCLSAGDFQKIMPPH
jgi:hypothetical protein